MSTKKLLLAALILTTGFVPFAASAAFDDVFNCQKNNQGGSAGSTTVLGGPYVPVADYAVELNTGLLVYKECILREIATAKRKAGLASVDERVLTQFNNGNGGSGFPSRELGKEEVQLADRTMLRYLQNDTLTPFSDSVEGKVKQGIARGYSYMRDPRKAFVCEYEGDLEAVYEGIPTGNYWDGFGAVVDDPACSVLFATDLGSEALARQTAYEMYKNRSRLEWGDGVYDVAHYDEDGFRITDTPGDFVKALALQSLTSPYVQAQQADDIGEMIDGMYLGVTTQSLTPGSTGSDGTTTGVGGLAGLTQALGGALSYMAQVVQNTGQGYTGATANATIGMLQSALQTERQYNSAVTSSANLFTQTNATLRSKEAACFPKIANAICESGSISGNTCTASGSGTTLTIATSTAFSQKVIDTSIRSLANATVANLNSSNQIISRIQQLIAGVQANPTQAVQTAALAALAALNPHSGSDVSAAQQNQQSLSTMMANLLTNTSTAWEESEDPTVGWCNTNNTGAMDKWKACWGGDSSACPTP